MSGTYVAPVGDRQADLPGSNQVVYWTVVPDVKPTHRSPSPQKISTYFYSDHHKIFAWRGVLDSVLFMTSKNSRVYGIIWCQVSHCVTPWSGAAECIALGRGRKPSLNGTMCKYADVASKYGTLIYGLVLTEFCFVRSDWTRLQISVGLFLLVVSARSKADLRLEPTEPMMTDLFLAPETSHFIGFFPPCHEESAGWNLSRFSKSLYRLFIHSFSHFFVHFLNNDMSSTFLLSPEQHTYLLRSR